MVEYSLMDKVDAASNRGIVTKNRRNYAKSEQGIRLCSANIRVQIHSYMYVAWNTNTTKVNVQFFFQQKFFMKP